MEKLERKIMTVILVIVVILALFLGLIGFISDFMWFKEMGYTAVLFQTAGDAAHGGDTDLPRGDGDGDALSASSA